MSFRFGCPCASRVNLGQPRYETAPGALRGMRYTALSEVRGTRYTALSAVRGTRYTALCAVRGMPTPAKARCAVRGRQQSARRAVHGPLAALHGWPCAKLGQISAVRGTRYAAPRKSSAVRGTQYTALSAVRGTRHTALSAVRGMRYTALCAVHGMPIPRKRGPRYAVDRTQNRSRAIRHLCQSSSLTPNALLARSGASGCPTPLRSSKTCSIAVSVGCSTPLRSSKTCSQLITSARAHKHGRYMVCIALQIQNLIRKGDGCGHIHTAYIRTL